MIGLRNDSGYDNKRSLEEGVSFDSYLSAWTQNLDGELSRLTCSSQYNSI